MTVSDVLAMLPIADPFDGSEQSAMLMKRGAPLDAPEVRELARPWQERVAMFVHDRPDFGMASGRILSEEPAIRAPMGLDADVVMYVARATATLHER